MPHLGFRLAARRAAGTLVRVDLHAQVAFRRYLLHEQRKTSTRARAGEVCAKLHAKLIEATSVEQTSVFEAARLFARTEGTLPAPESSHAIRVAIDEALRCKREGKAETILFGLTGTGYFDMTAYARFNDGTMSDTIPTDEDIAASLAKLPQVG